MALTNKDTGKWMISTRTAVYSLNLDTRVGIRYPLYEPVTSGTLEEYVIAELRKDGEPFYIIDLVKCHVDYPMTLIIRGVSENPSVKTVRNTTPVILIERTDW